MDSTALSSGSLYKRLFALAIPMALQNIISFGVNLADNLMVGQLGESSISGVYVANQITYIFGMLVLGMGTALVILASQYWGRKDVESVKTIASMTTKLSLIVGVVFCLIMQFGGQFILSTITTEKAAIAEGMRYARIVSFSYIFYALTNVLLASMRCVGSVRIGLVVSISAFVTNVALNAVFIFGLLGFPAMGVAGAALATLISRVVEFGIAVYFVLKVDKKLCMKILDITRFNGRLAADFVRYGGPVILGDILWGVGMAAHAYILGRMGEMAMSASSIAGNINQIFAVMVYGTAGAAGVIIGQTVGEGDLQRIKSYSKKLQMVFLGIGLASGLLLFASKGFVLMFYSNLQLQTLEYTIQFLIILSISLVGTGYQMSVLTGIVRAGGATHFVLINDLIFVWLVVIPSSAVAAFVFHAPVWVVFALLKGDQIYKCFVAAIKVNRFKWIRKLTREEVM